MYLMSIRFRTLSPSPCPGRAVFPRSGASRRGATPHSVRPQDNLKRAHLGASLTQKNPEGTPTNQVSRRGNALFLALLDFKRPRKLLRQLAGFFLDRIQQQRTPDHDARVDDDAFFLDAQDFVIRLEFIKIL